MINYHDIDAWVDGDVDDVARGEIIALREAASTNESIAADLADRFAGTLEFGTAGLRGALGAGPNRMNRSVVIRAAAGLSQWLRHKVGENFTVVIGSDARHGSAQFAQDTAAVVTAAGGRALLLPFQQPTPVLAFAVRHLDAHAGVMVTASHNPKNDNGYKVYLGGRAVDSDAERGVQIISPADTAIAAAIAEQPYAVEVPMAEAGWVTLGDEVRQAYIERAIDFIPKGRAAQLRIVYTALHGVGAATALEAFERAGFDDVHSVREQAKPDPDFPTVVFPNPEEDGALDLAFKLAERVNAEIVIANDPDADRCSIAIPTPEGYWQLSGDQVGALLGYQAAAYAATGTGGVLANSIVSSRMLEKIAASHGLRHQYTLTGFKWISRVDRLVFGYEEALGYCVDPQAVRDKDGISAALRLSMLASDLANSNMTLADLLDDLELRHGVHATQPLTIRVDDLSIISDAMARLRANPLTTIAGSPVLESADLSEGGWKNLPTTDALYYVTKTQDRIVIRPSGTEPKLKCYLESIAKPKAQTPEALDAARTVAYDRVETVRAFMKKLLAQP